jgi:hypothetical protein
MKTILKSAIAVSLILSFLNVAFAATTLPNKAETIEFIKKKWASKLKDATNLKLLSGWSEQYSYDMMGGKYFGIPKDVAYISLEYTLPKSKKNKHEAVHVANITASRKVRKGDLNWKISRFEVVESKFPGVKTPSDDELDKMAKDFLFSNTKDVFHRLAYRDAVYVFEFKTLRGGFARKEFKSPTEFTYAAAVAWLEGNFGKRKCRVKPKRQKVMLTAVNNGGKWKVTKAKWSMKFPVHKDLHYADIEKGVCEAPDGMKKISEAGGLSTAANQARFFGTGAKWYLDAIAKKRAKEEAKAKKIIERQKRAKK